MIPTNGWHAFWFYIMHNVLQLESLQQENEQLKDKLEEVTLDLEILKNEVSEGGKIIFSIEY